MIQGNAQGHTAFPAGDRTRNAILRLVETLTDAATHLPDDVRTRHPQIPWRQVRDFCTVLAHGYVEIKEDEIWRTVQTDLPALKVAVVEEFDRIGPADVAKGSAQ